MAIVTGHDLRIFIGTKPVAGAKSCSMKINNDLNEVATKNTGRAKSYTYARYDYTLDSDGMYLGSLSTENGVIVTSNKELIAAALSATTLTFEFKASSAGETGYTKYSGSVLIKSADIGAPDYKEMTFKASFQGSGDLVATDVAV